MQAIIFKPVRVLLLEAVSAADHLDQEIQSRIGGFLLAAELLANGSLTDRQRLSNCTFAAATNAVNEARACYPEVKRLLTRASDKPEFFSKSLEMQALPLGLTRVLALVNVHTVVLISSSLRDLPLAFGTLANLQLLNLSHNLLAEVPEALRGCRRMKNVCVSYNRLNELPAWIPDSWPHLEDISCTGHVLHGMAELPLDLLALSDVKSLEICGPPLLAHQPELREQGTLSLTVIQVYMKEWADRYPSVHEGVDRAEGSFDPSTSTGGPPLLPPAEILFREVRAPTPRHGLCCFFDYSALCVCLLKTLCDTF